MCSQFENKFPIHDIIKKTNSIILDDDVLGNWNRHIYPYTKSAVVTAAEQQNILRLMQYSLVPSWSDTAKPKFSTYNARLDRNNKLGQQEFIYNAPTWRNAFCRQHCIVPLSSFFESCTTGSHAGNIVRFASSDFSEMLFAAAIWDSWTDKLSGEVINSFAILTDEPNDFLLEVGHDRQPVFLSSENMQTWLYSEMNSRQWYDFLKSNQYTPEYAVTNERVLSGWQNSLF